MNNELDEKLIAELDSLRKKGDDKGYLSLINKRLEEVKIRESNEKMLFLPNYLDKKIFIEIESEFAREKGLYLREGIVKMLNKAQSFLPEGYHLKIVHAFRSQEVVWKLYHKYFQIGKKRYPNSSDEEIDLKIRNILAMPDDPQPPGHMTGGAIDVLLANKDGRRLKLKVSQKKVSKEKQDTTFCEELPEIILKNRKILFDALTKVGFNNYPREFWHYSYGDPYWAVRRKEKIAIYGIPDNKLFRD